MIACEDNIYVQGGRLYQFHCESCHMTDGSGLEAIIPPIQTSDYLTNKLTELPCLIRHGIAEYKLDDSILLEMPANYDLTEYEINNIINYLQVKWETNHILSIDSTKQLLEDCPIPLYKFEK